MKKKLAYFLAIVLGLLLTAEISLRVIGLGNPPIYEASDEYGYRFIPDQDITRFSSRIYFNAHGLRSGEISQMPPPGVVRVLCLGDSITYGGALTTQKKTYPYLLEARLQGRSPGKFEVLNASAPSWGIRNEESYIAKHGIYNSSIVVLQIGTDDLFTGKSSGDAVGRSPQYPDKRPVSAIGELFARYIRLPWVNRPLTASRETETARPGPSETFQENLESLEEIHRYVAAEGARLVIVLMERLSDAAKSSERYDAAEEIVAEWCDMEGIPFANLGKIFRAHGGDILFRDDIHPNEQGNKVLAEGVTRLVLRVLNGDEG